MSSKHVTYGGAGGGFYPETRRAPQQKDLLTDRWRIVKARTPRESQIQIALIQLCRLQARKDCVYFHIPNGELRTKRAGAKLKAMGELAGVADLEFIWPDDVDGRLRVLFLELKAGTRRKRTPEQVVFGESVERTGCSVYCANNFDDAVSALQAYGILPMPKGR